MHLAGHKRDVRGTHVGGVAEIFRHRLHARSRKKGPLHRRATIAGEMGEVAVREHVQRVVARRVAEGDVRHHRRQTHHGALDIDQVEDLDLQIPPHSSRRRLNRQGDGDGLARNLGDARPNQFQQNEAQNQANRGSGRA